LAVRAKRIGRNKLKQFANIASPDTILKWYRELIARKWTYKRKGVGRRRTRKEIMELILQMARENEGWGYTRIVGALKNLKCNLSRTTVANILKENGMDPAPERSKKRNWKTFLRSHWEHMAASDFFSVEVLTLHGLVTYYVLFVIELLTRRVKIVGITPNPDGEFMAKCARNLTDCDDGFLLGKKYMIRDRDTKYTAKFDKLLKDSGTKPIKLPPRSPNLNSYAERYVLSIKSECLNRFVVFGEKMLWEITKEFSAHYHTERNHQGVGNELIELPQAPKEESGGMVKFSRLGGVLNYYERQAA
jgi:transposase InsO family protein